MRLFSEDKNLFLKIVNVILLLWFIGAIVVCYANLINLLMPEPLSTYEEYKISNCKYFPKETDKTDEELCEEEYEGYTFMEERSAYYNKKGLLIAFGNVVIVGGILTFLNRKKEK